MTELAPGQNLANRFELIRLLGQGGMGQVWLAKDAELGEEVAVKVLDDRLTNQAGMLELLRRECRQARRLVHPNIVRVYDFHQDDGRAFITMEYVAGGEIDRFRDAQPAEILRHIIPLTDALAYAHTQGVIHRDLKPPNILIDQGGKPRLVDFGIAGLMDGDGALKISGGGSPLSRSPEQRDGQPPSPTDDAFSLGVLIYELVSGLPPRVASDLAPPEPLHSRMNYSVPRNLRDLVARLLAFDAASRPGDMAMIRRELEAALEECWSQTVPPEIKVTRTATAGDHQITPVARHTAPQQLRRDPVASGHKRSMTMAWVAFAILVALLLAVVLVLPRYVGQQADQDQMVELDDGETAINELALLTEQKGDADALREEFDLLAKSLADRGVTEWDASDYEDALAVAEAAIQAYEATQFITATETWGAGLERLRSLDARASELLVDSLARGQQAIERGQREIAEKEFSIALQVDPGNETAIAGMARAEHIEEVFGSMAEAESLEQQGQLHEARDLYRKVAELDGEIEEAPEGIRRIDAAIVEQSYSKAMSTGYASLGLEDYEAARKAFRTAARIHPNASEPREGLERVAGGIRVTGIEGHRDRAANLEASEKWRDAVAEYDAALAIDAGLVFAQEGRLRATARADLDERLQGFIDEPDRLYTVNVLQSAGEAIQQAGRVPNPGPRLVGQATRLAGLMEQATQKVAVTLRSDNMTEVVVFRVGRLGAFEQFDLQLTPGIYTVQGTRKGYRDVQRKLTVRPGQTIDPVMIQCEEPI